MGRTILQYTERNTVSDVLEVNSSPRVEIFNLSTYTTAAYAGSATAVIVKDTSGFSVGDLIFVGTDSTPRSIASISTVEGTVGPGTLNTSTGVSYEWADNTSVLLYKVGGTEDYSTIYEQDDMTDAFVDPFPWTADANNEWAFFISVGEYGVRYSSGTGEGTTLRTDHTIEFTENSDVVPTGGSSSISGGLYEAVNKIPGAGVGGTVQMENGTLVLSLPVGATPNEVSLPEGTRLLGKGPQNTTIRLADGASPNIPNNCLINLLGVDDVTLNGFTLDGNIGNAANQAAEDYDGVRGVGSNPNLVIHDVIIKQVRNGVNMIGTSGASDNVQLTRVFVQDVSAKGFYLDRLTNSFVENCRVVSSGDTGLELNANTSISQEVRIINNYVNRAVAPTYIDSNLTTEKNHLMRISNSEDVLISNNVLWDNRNVDNAGRGISTEATTTDRISIYSNRIGYAVGMGLSAPNNSHVQGNFIYRPGIHPIVIEVPGQIDYGSVLIHDNMFIDPNEQNIPVNVSGVNCIHSSLDVLDPTACTIEKLSIQGNQLRDSRSRTYSGVQLRTQHAISSTVADLILTNNDFSDATMLMEWRGTALDDDPSFGSYIIRNNLSADAYTGTATLVAGTLDITNANWPPTAGGGISVPLFNLGRQSINGSTALGNPSMLYDGANTKVTLTSHTSGTPGTPVAADVSIFFWEFVGSPT